MYPSLTSTIQNHLELSLPFSLVLDVPAIAASE